MSSLRARWLNLHDNGQHLYNIYSQQDLESQLSWSLVVANPVAILQCFRANLGGSVQNMAHLLLHSGIPFNTFAPSLQMDSNLPKKLTYAVHKLTHRPIKHKPTTGDYTRYEEICDQVLSHPYKQAALLEGGIVWQLALQALEYSTNSEFFITQGPSEDAFSRGRSLKSDTRALYDNSLSDDKQDLICRVYELETGMLLNV